MSGTNDADKPSEAKLIESDTALLDYPTTEELAAEKRRAAVRNSQEALRALGIDPTSQGDPPPPDYADEAKERTDKTGNSEGVNHAE